MMRHPLLRRLLLTSTLCALPSVTGSAAPGAVPSPAQAEPRSALQDGGAAVALGAAESVRQHVDERLLEDLAMVRTFRPAYGFWQHIFTIPDGRVVFGSARDGRLLATFPARGDWARDAEWHDPDLAGELRPILTNRRLPVPLNQRRDEVVRLLEPTTGPLVHNPTRGLFLLPNVKRYGAFLNEWSVIYERFGVPADIGLAQAILESGLNGTARSRANALGFCQFLSRNWDRLNRATPHVIEAFNQTTQAPYCAAYLSVLATMYGSFIPALSEHHAGGVNVGRAVINGERLGGANTREQYLLGAEFARNLRSVALQRYRDLYRTYGIRSFLYAEMVFGNTLTVSRLREEVPQTRIFAMRTPRALTLAEIAQRSGLPTEEVKRYNPALVRQVPARANVYLPKYVPAFGPNVSFWHQPPSPEYAAVLAEFVQLEPGVQRWLEPSFDPILRGFERRFQQTGTEEGQIMAATISYVLDDLRTSRRAAILDEFRTSGRILQLFNLGVSELAAILPSSN